LRYMSAMIRKQPCTYNFRLLPSVSQTTLKERIAQESK
jgi:hypothetical protein